MYSYNRDSKIMRKLLGKAAPETATGDVSVSDAPSATVAYRPLKSQNAVYAAGVPVSCLDVAPDRRAVVLAGPHILKTVVQNEGGSEAKAHAAAPGFSFSEGIDLRAAITAQASAGNGTGTRAGAMADQLNIRDVKWHGNSTIFTACANGSIFAYDLARFGAAPSSGPGSGSEPLHHIQIREDSRQVNTLDVNPHLKSWLLSGSQDGMARVFDVSAPRQNRSGVLTFRQRFAPLRCIDSVRQVTWSPKVGHEMAACTEAGVILKWDVRQAARPLLRINAHDKACTAIAWHPDGIHLISAGRDTKLHVWDLSNTADKRQKPKWSINTPAPVTAVAWRPGLWSASAQSRRVAQVAVTYDDNTNKRYGTPVVHIWDLARPTMPYKEIERFDSSPSALSWQDQDMLWTVGQDGLFNQCDVAFAPRVTERHSTTALAFSSRGDALMFLDERPEPPRPRPSVAHMDSETAHHGGAYIASPHTPMLSVSRSDSEEDVVGSFLGPRRRSGRKPRTSTRSPQSMSTTPPTGSGEPDELKQILGLEQAIRTTGIFKSQQAMASGHIPAAMTPGVYEYLSSMYLEAIERDLPHTEGAKPLVQRVTAIMEQFAKAAEATSLFRLAQTWRILSFAMNLLLKRRAQYHVETRVARFQKMKIDERRSMDRLRPGSGNGFGHGEETPTRASAQASSFDGRLAVRSLLSEEIESTSNVPTPVARPADSIEATDFQVQPYQPGRKLSPIVEPDSFTLGPALHSHFPESPRKRLDSEPISVQSHESGHSGRSQISSTEGYDFYDTDVLAKAIDVPHSKDSRSWDYAAARPSNGRAKVARHDSDESFGQMFSISDGKQSAMRSPANTLSRQTSDMEKQDDRASSEYESRIRGEQIHKSPKPLADRKNGPKADSPEEVFMISQTTMTSDDTYPSQTSFPSQTDSDVSPQHGQGQDLARFESNRSSSPAKTYRAAQFDSNPHIIEADYLPWDDDPPYPHPLQHTGSKTVTSPVSSLDPYTLLSRALNFESRTSALNASAMVLLLKPLVPNSVIDTFQASSILRQHHSRLMRMGLFVEATLLRNLCVAGWPAGLPDWGENYTAIFAQAQQDVKVGFFCSSCRKPREVDPAVDGAIWTCERCKTAMAQCAVCGHRELEVAASTPVEITEGLASDVDSWLPAWWYCPGCAHGGHASCLQAWHAPNDSAEDHSSKYSDGCCPLDGCGHACLPGKYRGETATARADELGRAAVESARSRDERRTSTSNSRRSSPRPVGNNPGNGDYSASSSVRSDANDVPQSRAVGVARETLNKGSSGGGILSSSPGRTVAGGERTGERERRKSVKFARPER